MTINYHYLEKGRETRRPPSPPKKDKPSVDQDDVISSYRALHRILGAHEAPEDLLSSSQTYMYGSWL